MSIKEMHSWKCDEIFSDYSLLILNTTIKRESTILNLWKKAKFKILVDGGANQFYHALSKHKLMNYLPDIVCGDFDSIENEVSEFYKSKGSQIIHTPDQNKTDLRKALEISRDKSETKNTIVFCENEGRLDHIMGNINILYEPSLSDLQIFMLGEMHLLWLLTTGEHKIDVPFSLWNESEYCALIPLGNPCQCVSTTGLKWNINKQKMHFGGLVSTSNTYDTKKTIPEVCISTDEPILWSMSFNSEICSL